MKAAIAVIGAGNIGTRHLQAILKCQEPCDIFAVEPNEQARDKSQEILGEQRNRVKFCSELYELPGALDIVVVAVSSMVRRKIVESLLEHVKVRFLILEKVLFPQIEDYAAIKALLDRTGTKAWVNCVRRAWPYTQRIQELFAQSKQVIMHVSGNMWGIACNTIHYVDWLCAVTQSDLVPEFDISRLDDEILKSKRSGYVEFTGELSVVMGNHTLVLTSNKGNFDGFVITVDNGEILCTLREHEDKGICTIYDRVTGKKTEEEYECPYLSNLTNRLVSMLLKEQSCPLVEYEQSVRQHIPMIQAFLRKLGTDSGYCNIT